MGPVIFRQLRRGARRPRAACALAFALAGLGLAAAPARAQDSGTADTVGVILTPGSIINTDEMDFGQIAPSGAAGTVALSASASPTCTPAGGVVHSGNCQAAAFAIYGRQNWRVRLRQTGAVVLTGPGGATMTVTNFTLGTVGMSPGQGGGNGWNLGVWNIDTLDGTTEIYLGGTLNVGALQAPGVYNGTVLVEAVFN